MNILHESPGKLTFAEPRQKYILYFVLCVLMIPLAFSLLPRLDILNETWTFVLVSVFFALGVFLLLSMARRVCEFDREAGLITITSHRFYGSRVRHIAWSDIVGVRARDMGLDNPGTAFWLALSDGSEVLLTECDVNLDFTNPDEKELRRALVELGMKIDE
ncbi:MAG: hypothetical protein FJ304_15130 [Planctomycetes bacterium]|nr:hypothetical protein [Planctomycetota bacterium]